MLIGEAIRGFLLSRSSAGRSPHTVKFYRQHLNRFMDWANSAGLDWRTIAPGQIQAFTGAGAGKYSNHARFRTLRAFYRYAEEQGEIDKSPVSRVTPPKLPSRIGRYATPEEFRRLLGAIGNDRWTDSRDRAILLVLFYSGLRVAEVAGLSREDIDLASGLITVHSGKGDKDRIVPFSPELPAVLVEYLFNHPAWPEGDLVHSATVAGVDPEIFRSRLWYSDNGAGGVRGPLTTDGIRMVLRRRCAGAGIRYLSPHAFRRGFAMQFLNAGADLYTVSEWLGHSSPAITRAAYARLLPAGIQSAYASAYERLTRTK